MEGCWSLDLEEKRGEDSGVGPWIHFPFKNVPPAVVVTRVILPMRKPSYVIWRKRYSPVFPFVYYFPNAWAQDKPGHQHLPLFTNTCNNWWCIQTASRYNADLYPLHAIFPKIILKKKPLLTYVYNSIRTLIVSQFPIRVFNFEGIHLLFPPSFFSGSQKLRKTGTSPPIKM